MTHVRTAGKRFDGDGKHTGPGEWLDVIHAANGIEPGMFGQPDSQGDWWAGGYAEEYQHARVLFREDGTVSVVSKTDRGAQVLAQAAASLGINATGVPAHG